jgi:hypothetical protein
LCTGVRREDFRSVRRGQHDVADTGGTQALELMLDEGTAGDRKQRLGRRDRERPKTGALATDQDDRVDRAPAQPAIARA